MTTIELTQRVSMIAIEDRAGASVDLADPVKMVERLLPES
jgi:hypothetical protein